MAIVFDSNKDSSIDENFALVLIPGLVDKGSLDVGALSLTLIAEEDGSYSISIMLTPETVSAYSSGVYNFDFELHFDSSYLGAIELSQITSQGAVVAANTQVPGQISVSSASFPDSVQVDAPLMTIALGQIADISAISFDISNVTIGLDSLQSSSYKFLPAVVIYTAQVTSDGSDIVYSLAEGSDPVLNIDGQTGDVFVTGALSYEDYSSYSFTVVATDSDGTSIDQAVTVAVNDIDQLAPAIISGDAAVAINENSGASQIIYTALADDSGDISGGVSFALAEGSDSALKIDATSGAVTLTSDPDHETQSAYNFTVVATDAAGNVSEQAVTLDINDLDEVAPTITSGATAIAIDENSGANQVIYTAVVDDNSDVTFSLSDGSDAALAIDEVTGVVSLSIDPDYESQSSYSFTVVATDAAGNASEQAVTLSVNDIVSVVGGSSGDDQILATGERDVIDGGDGVDSVTYSGPIAQYSISRDTNGAILVRDLSSNANTEEATDELTNIENVIFSDDSLALTSSYFRGAEVELNSDRAYEPEIIALNGGGYVVVWKSGDNTVSGQLFDETGSKLDDAFTVNDASLSNSVVYPSADALADGGFVVTWQSHSGDNWEVYARRYDIDGAAEQSFEINAEFSGDQVRPAVIGTAGGGYTVSWGVNRDGNWDIFAQQYDASNTPGVAFDVNRLYAGDQSTPSLTELSNGDFVVTWWSSGGYNDDDSGRGVYGRLFSSEGVAVGQKFLVNTYTDNDQDDSSVSALADGGFIAVWRSYQQDGSQHGIFAQRFDQAGAKVGQEFRVNDVTSNLQGEPKVVAMPDGGWMVVYVSYNHPDGEYDSIFSKRFDADGLPMGVEALVSSGEGNYQQQPAVAVLADESYVVAWREDQTNNIELRQYTAIEQLSSSSAVIGTEGSDLLLGDAGSDLIVGGAGDDNIDGGSGYNTLQVFGTADAFYWTVNSSGQVIFSDLVADPDDLVNGSDQGVDTLTNIQSILYVDPVSGETTTFELDDHGNSSDAENLEIQFGVPVSGRTNFYGDKDYFLIDIDETANYIFTGSNDSVYVELGDSSFWIYSNSSEREISGSDELQDLVVRTNLDSNSPRSGRNYEFTIRRALDHSDVVPGERVEAGDSFEYIKAGLGDDIVIGSDRSDIIYGGEGNDVITAGQGDDFLYGDGGAANVAVFSGVRADYELSWQGGERDLHLEIKDTVPDRDGQDILRNIQILRFSDGDLVLDTEANTQNFNDVDIGESIEGSIPIGFNWWELDQDYFQQVFSGDISTDTTLRVRFEFVNLPDNTNGDLYAQFYFMGSSDVLIFEDDAGNTRDSFNISRWAPVREWFVSPESWGGNADFVAMPQRADVRIYGNAHNESSVVGDLAEYRLVVDKVILGENSDDVIAGVEDVGYIDARGGNDTVTGSIAGEEILGGSGDDTLSGGGGDDILRDSQGSNVLSGDAGDDVIDITGNGNPAAQIDGGEGTDTLRVDSNVNWDNVTVQNVEVLDGNGGDSSLTVQEVLDKSFSSAQNIEFRLDQNQNDGEIDASGLSGDLTLRGTNYSDVLIGNDDNNTIFLRANNNVDISGNGLDSVQARAGDDFIQWQTDDWVSWSGFFSAADQATNTYFLTGSIDGGDGTDTLNLHIGGNYWYSVQGGYIKDSQPWAIDLTGLNLTDIETLSATGQYYGDQSRYPSQFILTVDQLASLDSATGLIAVVIKGGGTIDLAHLATLNITDWEIGDDLAYSFEGTSGSDTVEVGAGQSIVNTGGGDDTIRISDESDPTNILDGGEGQDTLVISGSDVDLSSVSIAGVEAIRVSSESLAISSDQWNTYGEKITRAAGASTEFTLALDSASVETLSDDSLFVGFSGSDEGDQLTGNASDNIILGNAGDDVLIGGAGDDRLVAGAGVDELHGGEGADSLDVTGKAVVTDVIDGGEGEDTLTVADGQDLSGASLSGIEIIAGEGTIRLTVAQLALLSEVRGVNVHLIGEDAGFQTPSTIALTQGAWVALADGTILGSTGNDSLSAGSGDQVFALGAGDDVIDGGSGYNTVQVSGLEDAFYWTINSSGEVVLTDLVTGSEDPIDGSNEGTDTLTNVQAIRYVNPVTGEAEVFELDDHGNSPDAGNQQIGFGEIIAGRADFYGDKDYFTIDLPDSGEYVFTGLSGNNFNVQINESNVYVDNSNRTVTLAGDSDIQDVGVHVSLNSNAPLNSAAYSFVIRRALEGTNGSDLALVAGDAYEYIDAGDGDDVIVGSARSDLLYGGDGNDVITGGAGDDWIYGQGGAQDIAVFTGNRDEYEIEWSGGNQNLSLTIQDTVAGRDGRDTLQNIQILRFADGDLVLDTESNEPNSNAFLIGQAIEGTLPLGDRYQTIDQDYFQQRFTSDISPDTMLRVRLEILDTDVYSRVYAEFRLMGAGDRLVFEDDNGNSISQFELYGNEGGNAYQDWFVSPQTWGSSSQFLPRGQRADIRIWGQARNNGAEFGDEVQYRLVVDKVILGDNSDDVIAGVEDVGYIDARGGNDTVTGSIAGEEILGGSGDDTLSGGGGDDILRDSQGSNVLSGDAGDDVIDTTGNGNPAAQIDGGEGTDTLRVDSNVNWDNVTVENVEILDGNGGQSSLTVQEVLDKGFTSANNIEFRLDQNQSNGEIDASGLSGDLTLRGTNQSDTLTGNDYDNTIYLRAHYHQNSNGQGSDTVYAGAGDDTVVWSTQNHGSWRDHFSAVDEASRTYFLGGDIDGGSGSDTLRLDFGGGYWYHSYGPRADSSGAEPWKIDLTGLNLSSIETLNATGQLGHATRYPSHFILTVDQLASLDSATGLTAVIIKGGGVIDLAHLATLNITDWEIGDDLAYTFEGTSESETIEVGDGPSTVNSGAGNDFIRINDTSSPSNIIDGAEGLDTLVISGSDVDLSGVSLSSIEEIRVSSQSLAMNEAQWAEFGAIVQVIPGAVTEFTLSLDDAATMSLTEDSLYAGFSGSAGDDRLIGNSHDNILVGNLGNDVLEGKSGDDVLVAGGGVDELSGGSGDDTLDVRGKQVVSDTLSGGDGTDTLRVEDGQDLTGADLVGLEVLSGDGTVVMTVGQLDLFNEVKGVSIQLVGDFTEFTMPQHLVLSQGAEILLPNSDSNLASDGGILGTVKDDVITGSSNDDAIFGGVGADVLSGGDGNDTLDGGKGTDTLIGGAGDDHVIVGGEQFTDNNRHIEGEILSGGAGNDILEIVFNVTTNNAIRWGSYRLSEGAVSGFETLEITQPYYSHLYLTAEQWLSFSEIQNSPDNSWDDRFQISVLGSLEDFEISNFSAERLRAFTFNGSFGDIDLTHDSLSIREWIYNRANFENLILGDQDAQVYISEDSDYSVTAGDGDHVIKHGRGGALQAGIDGGAGDDTFDVSETGFIDLTGTTLENIETVYFGNATIVLTDEQFSSWTLEGSGAIYTSADGIITGSNGNDSFNGDIRDLFEGGAGDDSINGIKAAIFSGNYADYDFVRSGSTLTVQHSRGTLTDGTDTLNDVLEMRFADTTVTVDDAPNNLYNFINNGEHGISGADLDELLSNLTEAAYGKRVTGKADYRGDPDVYFSELAPNSPLFVEMSTVNGSGWNLQFFDAETGRQIQLKSLVYGWIYGSYNNNMSPDAKWLPGFNTNDGFEAYQGGRVIVRLSVNANDDFPIEDYAFTLNYLDDYAGSRETLGEMDPQEGEIRGYIGDINDQDWIRTELIAGTKYEFNLLGVSSGGGTLVDPLLQLLDDQGRVIENGIGQATDTAGTDDSIIFRPTESGTYYLSASDVAGINTGSWTLTQESLDTIAGNVSTTERVELGASNFFRVESEINQLTDHDWFKVWLDKGITYSFTLDGTSLGGTLQDPQLSLRSVTGRLLTQDDNSGTGSDAEIYYSASDSGWYYLDAGASGNASRGTYVLRGSTLADDYANSILTEGVISLGEDTSGLISYIGDSDWLAVGLSANTTYVINLSGDISDGARLDPLTDPLLIIRDADGNVIFRADDFDGSLDARAYFTPEDNGLYFVEARSAFKYDIGAYTINVDLAPADDHGSVIDETATSVVLGDDSSALISGDIGTPGDKDVFQMDLEAGRVYLIGASGFAGFGGTLKDPYVRVFNSDGNLLDFDNNGGSGTDAEFYFAPDSSETFYIEVSSGQSTGQGTYELSVSQRNLPPDDVPNDLSTQVVLNPGDTFSGSLLTHNDEDWFAITLVEGESYVFRANASHSGSGSLEDPVLELRNTDGTLVKAVDDMLVSNEPALQHVASYSGTYFLVVKASNGQEDTGTYTLVTRAPDDHSNTQNDTTVIQLDQTLTGGIQWNDGSFGIRAFDSVGLANDFDEDWFSFEAEAGQVLSVNVQLADGSKLSRPMVEVVDSQGQIIAFGDGLETDNGFAAATFMAEDGGAYYARVVDGAGATGDYVIQLVEGDASDEDSDGPVGVTFSDDGTVRQSVTVATIGLSGDTDNFDVALQEGHSYRIETVAVRDSSVAPLASASLTMEWLADGATDVESISAGSDVTNPSFFDSAEFTASASGTLSINVAPLESTQTGRYQLRIIDLGTSLEDDLVDTVAEFNDSDQVVIAINENVEGRIDSAGDVDLVAVNLTQGNIYDFSIKGYQDGLGTLAEAQLRLVNEAGQLVSVGTYDPVTGRTELSISVFGDGRYFLEVTAKELPGNTGTYTLDTRLRGSDENVADDISGDTQSGVIVGPGQPATGEIEVAGDHDWMAVTLEAGKVYVIDVLADGNGAGGTLADSQLRLIGPDGVEVAADDNSGAGKDSHLQIAPTTSGTYYLDISSRFGELGTYTARVRELYSGVADPLAAAQWYLEQSGVLELDGQYTGAGITVSVVDDGIDMSHPDLQENLNFSLAYDTQFDTQDGNPKYPYLVGPPDNHGTAVAGIIAATANNETGIRGAAPDAELASTRVKWAWDHMIQALSLQWQFDVSNNSWGAISPFSDNFNSTGLTFAWVALRKGVEDGRDGLGTNFVFSAGNSAGAGDNTNYHNFQNAREVITVGATNADDTAAAFSTPGANVLVSTYGVGMITTDRHQPGWGYPRADDYYGNFTGTSASAPLVAGIVAMMLEANPNLGYRDVQKILAYATTHPDVQDWKENGASDWNLGGLQYNDQAGFGLVDAYAAVQLARTWTGQNTSVNEVSASARQFGMVEAIPDGTGSSFTMSFEIDSSLSVEHVELGIDLRHQRMGDLIITLTSPDGTTSTLMDRPTVNSERPFGLSGQDSGVPSHLLWDFSSVQFWGEEAAGTWTVTVTDVRAEQTGTIQSLSLRIYGERDDGNDTYVFTDEGFANQSGGLLEDEMGEDTINAAAVRFDAYIDLYEGIIAANATSHGIAEWTLVENAISGSGDDSLVGNSADNYLEAGAGKDVLEGREGDDILVGGAGQDTAFYTGLIAEYSVSWDPNSETITVVDIKISNGDDGTDTLSGIERLVFKDGEISLSDAVGNAPPVANSTVFDSPVYLESGMGIDYSLPDDAFTDADGEKSQDMEIVVSDAAGGELPDWLSYDPDTGTFSGVPPEDFQGTIKLRVEAIDEFGESAADMLTLQFGDNQSPVLDNPKELVVSEDEGLVSLGLSMPFDPEGTDVSIEITEIPGIGSLVDKAGNQVSVGATFTADELTELFYQTSADSNGDGGYVRFVATDEDGVSSESSVHIFVDAVNDAPRFTTDTSKLIIDYPDQATVALDIQLPSDPESTLETVRLSELPQMGQVTLDGNIVAVGQVLSFDQLSRLEFTLSENVNGPIGSVTIQATDPEGLATNWSLQLEVQGDAEYNSGTSGRDELYGSIGEDILYGRGGDDLLVGNAGDDRLLGGLGNDSLLGGSDDDKLDGSAGNDYLDGGSGQDFMTGGPGHDTYVVDSLGDVALEVISGGAGGKDLIMTSISLTAPDNIESLQAKGAESINLTGNDLDNILLGNAADNDISGGAGRDTLFGEEGDDDLDGGDGVDVMAGGLGDDTYYVSSRADRVVEQVGQGTDHVIAGSSYTLSSNVENLTLTGSGNFTAGGNSLDNHLTGNSGNNLLAGGLGADTLEGGMGDDIYVLSDSMDTIIDTGGEDTIRSNLDITLISDIENADLVGIADTTVIGNGLDNKLFGNMADNILDGAGGVDILTGGQGADTFVISNNGDGIAADTITDFNSGEDLIVVDLASFGIDPEALGLLSSGLVSADSFVSGAGARALDASDYFIFDTAQGLLLFDADGSGEGEAVVIAEIDMEKEDGTINAGDVFVGI